MVVYIISSILKQCWSVGYVSLLTFSFIFKKQKPMKYSNCWRNLNDLSFCKQKLCFSWWRWFYFPERTESESLSAGQIVGILIGTITLLIILIVILLVIRRHFRKGSYFTRDEHGFTNAMYLKTVESVSVSDDGAEKRNT